MNLSRNEAAEYAHMEMTQYWSDVEKDAQLLHHHLENGVSGETSNMDVFKRACELTKGISIGSGKTNRLFEYDNDIQVLYDQTWIYASLIGFGSITYKSSKKYL